MNDRSDPLQSRLRVLAEPSRFCILRLLQQGARRVGEVAAAVALSQSCTTRHLQALERAALVTRTPRGRVVIVALTPDAHALLSLLAGEALLAGAELPVERAAIPPPVVAPPRRRRASRSPAVRPQATRATPPPSDTPPASPPETARAAPPPAVRSRIEEFLL